MDSEPVGRDRPEVIAGQFRVLKRLGAGGMGEVYLAEQVGVGRRVVLKLVHAHLLAKNEERFRCANHAQTTGIGGRHHLRSIESTHLTSATAMNGSGWSGNVKVPAASA